MIGGGAAGYFSAIECGRVLQERLDSASYEVTLLEAGKSVLGKVLISGGGRCNVMHDPYKGVSLIAKVCYIVLMSRVIIFYHKLNVYIIKGYPRGSRELLGPFNSQFGPWETLGWFAERGLELKTESDGRMFPVTDL